MHAERAGGTQNGVHFAADNRQRLLAEEAELDRMVKELQATLPPSEGEPVSLRVSTHTRLTALFPGLPGWAGTRKTNLDFTEARDSEWQWHQLGHMQVCTPLQTDNHASTPPLSFYRPDALPVAQPTVSKHWRDSTYFAIYQLLAVKLHSSSVIDC